MKTLCLGKKESAFYKSLAGVMHYFSVQGFLDEHALGKAMEIVSYVKKGGYTHVLMPNPYGNNRRYNCYLQLKKNNIKVIASDRGALPDSWFFDAGFNADSSSFKKDAWNHPLTEAARRDVQQYIEQLTTSSETLEVNGDRIGQEALRKKLGFSGNKKIIFVPLQRPNDTVIKFFSEPVGSVGNFISWLIEAEKRLNAGGDEFVFLLKKHPLEQEYPVVDSQSKNIGFVPDDINFNDLIEISDAVALINSGVGLISLAYGKPVVCAGNAFYACTGLATRAIGLDDFVYALQSPLTPNLESVMRFYHHLLKNVYSFGKFSSSKVRDGQTYRTIVRKIDFYELRIHGKTIFKNAPILVSESNSAQHVGQKKKILFVIPLAPVPIYRGNQARIETVVKQAVDDPRYEVHLCILNRSFENKKSIDYSKEISAHFKGVSSVTVLKGLEFSGGKRLLKVESYLAKKHKNTIARSEISNYWDSPRKFRKAVANLLSRYNIDEVFVNYAAQMVTIPSSFSGRVVLDTHDYQYNHVKSDQEENNVKISVSLERFRRSEMLAINKADTVVAINPKEKEIMEGFCKKGEVICLPQFFPSYYKKLPNFLLNGYNALFVGSAANFNAGGLVWFLREVMPDIVSALPEFKLAVVGDVCRLEQVKEMAAEFPKNVVCLGRVGDLKAIYAQSDCVIAPILGGAGMKIKVIEALAHGKCVIGTAQACDGIVETSIASIIVSNNSKDFASAVCNLCEDNEKRESMENEGIRYFEENYSIEAQLPVIHSIFHG